MGRFRGSTGSAARWSDVGAANLKADPDREVPTKRSPVGFGIQPISRTDGEVMEWSIAVGASWEVRVS
jgi:hypothetical protein